MLVLTIKFLLSLFGAVMHFTIIKKYQYFKLSIISIFFWSLLIRWSFLIIWFFLFGGNGSGDVIGYESHIQWVLNGLIPNKDFESPYGFYFYYILAIPYKFFNHPISIIFTLHIFEFIGVLLFYLGIKKLISFDKGKLFLLLYFFNPLIIGWFAFDGQDEALLILGFGGLFFATVNTSKILKAFFSGFTLFVGKISGLAAVFPLFLKISIKEKLIIFLTLNLFLILPIFLESKVIGFQFEREEGFDNLSLTLFPGNIWFIVNQFFQSEVKNFLVVSNDQIILLSKILMVFISFLTLILLLKSYRKINETGFLTFGAILFTFSFQLSSSYTSPGFISVIVPFLIYLFILNNKLDSVKILLFIIYFLILPFDLNLFLRIMTASEDIYILKNFIIIFNIYQAFIILANIMVYYVVAKILIDKNLYQSSKLKL